MADAMNTVAINIWTSRAIPVLLVGLIGYATYVVIGPLTIVYLLGKRQNTGAVIPILIIYFLLFIFMAAAFFRLAYITFLEPPYVPLGPAAIRDRAKSRKKKGNDIELQEGIGSGEYNSGNGAIDPDSPGLEMFYTKDIFIAEMDGKPKWCTHCANWKPDRAHHCSSSGRCIAKMDHFCPWVGGPIGENNFKFFIQFTGWTALYCLHLVVVMAYYVHQQRTTPGERLNPQLAVALGLSAFFGLFAAGMTATSGELAIRNQTTVERLGAETRVHILAVIKPPPGTLPTVNEVEGPVPEYLEITYPLEANPIPEPNQNNLGDAPTILSDNQNLQAFSSANGAGAEENLPPSRDLSDGSTVVAAPGPYENANGATRSENKWPRKEIAERDLRATRTFNILKMPEAGYNPWDLGSARLNWETVMGTSVMDWFLPIRRSPSCNHDDDESYYTVGPMVDLLRSKYNLLPKSEIRAYGGRRRTERRDPAEIQELRSHSENERKDDHGDGRRKRRHHSKKQDKNALIEQPIDGSKGSERQ